MAHTSCTALPRVCVRTTLTRASSLQRWAARNTVTREGDMQKRFLWLGPPLLAAGIFLFALAGDFRAQETPPGGKAPGTQKLDNTVRDFLYEVIEKGRVVYNNKKDYQGC